MTTPIKKLNTLVMTVFSETENANELWMADDVQKQVKQMFVQKKQVDSHRKKDPNAPKRGKSAYLFFCSANREAVKRDLGQDAKATDVTRELGKRWNLLKNSSKQSDRKLFASYGSSASEDKSRYDNEKSAYVPEETDESSTPKRRGGKKVQKTGPKRAKSAYLFFCSALRDQVKSENSEYKATDITKELGKLWNELKLDESRAAELASYEAEASADKARYEAEKASMTTAAPAVSRKSRVPQAEDKPSKKAAAKTAPSQKKSRTVVEEEELEEEEVAPAPAVPSGKAPKKASASQKSDHVDGYQAFCSSRRSEFKTQFPNMKPNEITKKLSAAWKAMSPAEQSEWKS